MCFIIFRNYLRCRPPHPPLICPMCASDALLVPLHPLTPLSAGPPPPITARHRPSPPVSTADCPPSHHPRFGYVQAIDSLLTPQSGFRGKPGVRGGQN